MKFFSIPATGIAIISAILGWSFPVENSAILDSEPNLPGTSSYGGTATPVEYQLTARINLEPQPSGALVATLTVENKSALEMATVSSIEVQDGMSEPVQPTAISENAWMLAAKKKAAQHHTFKPLPDGAYKIEALISSIDATGELHGTIAEAYVSITSAKVQVLSFDEWLPLVAVSAPVLDPADPDPEPL